MDKRKTSTLNDRGKVHRLIDCLRYFIWWFYHVITNTPLFHRGPYLSAGLLCHPHKPFSGMSPPDGV